MSAGPTRRIPPLLTVLVVVGWSLPLAACSPSSSGHHTTAWSEIDPSAVVLPPARPLVETVAPTPTGWLAGGSVVMPDGSRHVAIWASPRTGGPWKLSRMSAIPGRDGPDETIFYLAGGPGGLVAFGYRRAPREGYPRPSTWFSTDGGSSWQEVLENREFFGGPDIIGFGGLASGPLGYTIAGTWTDAHGHPTVAVWHSHDGRLWSRDSGEPAFDGSGSQLPFARDVAEDSAGVLVVGTVETPTRGDPGATSGGLWFSPDGGTWSRLPIPRSTASGSFSFDAVGAIPRGWVVAGTCTRSGQVRPAIYVIGRDQRLNGPILLPGSTGPWVPQAVAVEGSAILVAGASGDQAALWQGRIQDPTVGWKSVPPPPPPPFTIRSTAIAFAGGTTVVTFTGSDSSTSWWRAGDGRIQPVG